jgi:predicted XRE-type DNA-binding protein
MQADQATIRALRADLALQIARHVGRGELTQSAAASRLGIPQPTLSKIVRGRVESLSLELLLRVAMRAGLSVVLQTGTDPAEAGVYASGSAQPAPARMPSRLADLARAAASASLRSLSPEKRLEAQLRHNELVTALHRAGARIAGSRPRSDR